MTTGVRHSPARGQSPRDGAGARPRADTGKELVARDHQRRLAASLPAVVKDRLPAFRNGVLARQRALRLRACAFTGAVLAGRRPNRARRRRDASSTRRRASACRYKRSFCDCSGAKASNGSAARAPCRWTCVRAARTAIENMLSESSFGSIFLRLNVANDLASPMRGRREDIEVLATHLPGGPRSRTEELRSLGSERR